MPTLSHSKNKRQSRRPAKFRKLSIPAALFERLREVLGCSTLQAENYCVTCLTDAARELEQDKRQELSNRVLVRKADGDIRPATQTRAHGR